MRLSKAAKGPLFDAPVAMATGQISFGSPPHNVKFTDTDTNTYTYRYFAIGPCNKTFIIIGILKSTSTSENEKAAFVHKFSS